MTYFVLRLRPVVTSLSVSLLFTFKALCFVLIFDWLRELSALNQTRHMRKKILTIIHQSESDWFVDNVFVYSTQAE